MMTDEIEGLIFAIKQRTDKKNEERDGQAKMEFQKACDEVASQRMTSKDEIMNEGYNHLNTHSDLMQSLWEKRERIVRDLQKEIVSFKAQLQ